MFSFKLTNSTPYPVMPYTVDFGDIRDDVTHAAYILESAYEINKRKKRNRRAVSYNSDHNEELRFNPNHDPKNGKFTSGGGSSFSEVDKNTNRGIIEESIKNGSIKLEINREKQARHMQETHEPGRSYLTISKVETQEIINQKYGTGRITTDRHNKPIKERINTEQIIGKDVDKLTGIETDTDKATIHYSKTGTHLVPRKEQNKND